jgi:hypothetical protein
MPDTPFRHKLMRMVLLTSGLVILFTCAIFVTYEVVTFKQSVARQLSILGKTIAQNSTAALAFDNADDARAVLAAFRADPHIVSAALYGKSGTLFASFPDHVEREDLPATLEADGSGAIYPVLYSRIDGRVAEHALAPDPVMGFDVLDGMRIITDLVGRVARA